jgi:hypothetical protein
MKRYLLVHAPSQAEPAVERRRANRPAVTDVDVVIPVYNEQRTLAASVRRLYSFLSVELPLTDLTHRLSS